MRKLVFGLILALGVVLVPLAAQADTVSDEAAFVTKINQLRASKGLPALVVHENLVAKARSWAAGMAAAGKIWHSTLSDGITADWKKLGENVGMGGSVDGLHAAFVASPGHYANLVDPNFGHVGIGIVMSGKTIFVAEMFMQMMPAKTAPAVTPSTTAPTAPKATTTTAPKVTTTTVAKPKARPLVTTTTAPKPTTTTTTTTAPPVAAPPVEEPPAPPVEATPVEAPRAPSVLLVSVLERLRTFDS
ncbi:MAG TPA: CAP domain-containing protein [Acidimicrobiia bacterium]|nr:CAP domain-containing protein [Acidimicrobiia bacterium]